MSFWSRPRNLVILGGVITGAFFVPTFGAKTSYALPFLPPPASLEQHLCDRIKELQREQSSN